jgi:hypothetical protein
MVFPWLAESLHSSSELPPTGYDEDIFIILGRSRAKRDFSLGRRRLKMKVHYVLSLAFVLLSTHPVAAQLPRTEPSQEPSQQPSQAQPVNQPKAPQANDQGNAPGTPVAEPGTIEGTVTDVNQDKIPGASVDLQGPSPSDHRTVMTDQDGVFEIDNVKPGIAYHVTVSSEGFSNWNSPVIMLAPGQRQVLLGIKLEIETQHTAITVNPEQEAVAQVKIEEKQRVLGVVPNFFEVFCPNPPGLTAKLKFQLAFKTATDPFTVAGVALLTAPNQAGKHPNYEGGAEGFAQRFGATYTNQFTYIMFGGAVLPSLLHQDPRYYRQGTGSWKSRAIHALSNPFITRGDNGRPQPNYSDLGGNVLSAAIANAYYPAANRGAGPMFQSVAINIGIRMGIRLLQEFVFHPSKAGVCP